MDDKIIIVFNHVKKNEQFDLEIPTNISAHELVISLTIAFGLDIDISDIKKCYLKAENPFLLIKGSKLIRDYGLRQGSTINYTK